MLVACSDRAFAFALAATCSAVAEVPVRSAVVEIVFTARQRTELETCFTRIIV